MKILENINTLRGADLAWGNPPDYVRLQARQLKMLIDRLVENLEGQCFAELSTKPATNASQVLNEMAEQLARERFGFKECDLCCDLMEPADLADHGEHGHLCSFCIAAVEASNAYITSREFGDAFLAAKAPAELAVLFDLDSKRSV